MDKTGRWMDDIITQGPFQLKKSRILGSRLGILEPKPSPDSSTDFWGETMIWKQLPLTKDSSVQEEVY